MILPLQCSHSHQQQGGLLRNSSSPLLVRLTSNSRLVRWRRSRLPPNDLTKMTFWPDWWMVTRVLPTPPSQSMLQRSTAYSRLWGKVVSGLTASSRDAMLLSQFANELSMEEHSKFRNSSVYRSMELFPTDKLWQVQEGTLSVLARCNTMQGLLCIKAPNT